MMFRTDQQFVCLVGSQADLQIACVMAHKKAKAPEVANQAGKLIGYARVSTDDQELRMQIDALERAGCWNIYREKASAFRPGRKRPELELALIDLRPNDTLVVWRLDRLGRNLHETIKLLDRVRETGAGFKSLTENIDLSTAVGKLMFHIIGAFAEFEAASTSQRTAAGIRAIQERGLSYGAKPKLSAKRAAELVKLRKADPKRWTKAALARKFRLSPASITNYINRARRRRK